MGEPQEAAAGGAAKAAVEAPSDSSLTRELSPVRGTTPQEYSVCGELYSDRGYQLLKAFSVRRQCDVVIKVVDLEATPDTLDMMRKEVEVLRRCQHENIVFLHEVFNLDQELWMVWDCMDKGSCKDQIRTKYISGFPEDMLAHFILGTLQAICYFHAEDIIHRDLRADCILLNSHGHVKVTDFQISSAEEKGKSSRAFTFVGTPSWMAPEVLEQEVGYNCKADIWSLGITAWELAAGTSPFEGMRPLKVLKSILMSAPPRLKGRCYSAELCDLVAMCLVRDPAERPEAHELLQHPLFQVARKPDPEELVDLECLPLDDPRISLASEQDVLWTLDLDDVAELEHMTETELQKTPEELAGTTRGSGRWSGGRGSGGRSRSSRVLSSRCVRELRLAAQREDQEESGAAKRGIGVARASPKSSGDRSKLKEEAAAVKDEEQVDGKVPSAGGGAGASSAAEGEQESAKLKPPETEKADTRVQDNLQDSKGAAELDEAPSDAGKKAPLVNSVDSKAAEDGAANPLANVQPSQRSGVQSPPRQGAPVQHESPGNTGRQGSSPRAIGVGGTPPRMLGSPGLFGSPVTVGAGRGKRGSTESESVSFGSPQTSSVSLRLPAMSPSLNNSHVVGKEVEERCEECGDYVCECPGRKYRVVVERDDVWGELERLLNEPASPVKGHGGNGIEMPPVMSLDDPSVLEGNDQHLRPPSQDGGRKPGAARRLSTSTSRLLFLQDVEEIQNHGPEGQNDLLITLRNPSGWKGEWSEGVEEKWSQPLDDETRERRHSEPDLASYPSAIFDMDRDAPSSTGSHGFEVDRSISETSLGGDRLGSTGVPSAPVSGNGSVVSTGPRGVSGGDGEWGQGQQDQDKNAASKGGDTRKKKFFIKDIADNEFSSSSSSLVPPTVPPTNPAPPTSSSSSAPPQPSSLLAPANAGTGMSAGKEDTEVVAHTASSGGEPVVREGGGNALQSEKSGDKDGEQGSCVVGEVASSEGPKAAGKTTSGGDGAKGKSRFAIKDAPAEQPQRDRRHSRDLKSVKFDVSAVEINGSEGGQRSPLQQQAQSAGRGAGACELCSDCCAGRNGSCVAVLDVDALGETELRRSAKELQSLLRTLQRDKRELEEEVKKLRGNCDANVAGVQ